MGLDGRATGQFLIDGLDLEELSLGKLVEFNGQTFWDLDEQAMIKGFNGDVQFLIEADVALRDSNLDKYPNNDPVIQAKTLFKKCLKMGSRIASTLERESVLSESLNKMQQISNVCIKDGDIHSALCVKCLLLSAIINIIVFPSPDMLKRGHDVIDSIGKDFEGLDDNKAAKDKAFRLVFNRVVKVQNFDTDFQKILLRDVLIPQCPNEGCRTLLEERVSIMFEKDRLEFEPLLPRGEAAPLNKKQQQSIIEKSILKEDFEKALKYCQDLGTGLDFQRYTLEISEKILDLDKKRELLKGLAIKDAKFFPKFKSAYSEDEWKAAIPALMKDCAGTPLCAQLLIDQGKKGKMLEMCMSNPSLTQELAERILPESKETLSKLFVKNIYDKAEAATCRKDLREVCDLIAKYKELFNVSDNSLKEDFMKKNNRNRAFLEELRRVR